VRARAPKWEETLAGRTNLFFWRHTTACSAKMPTDVGKILQYFEKVEHLFDIYEVPADLRSKLLTLHLSERAKSHR